MNILRKISNDPRGYIVSKYISYKNSIIAFYSTIKCRTIMTIKGVEYGRGSKFRGTTMFHRSPESIIKIGNNVTFNSSSRFNFRGINHKCILQTTRLRTISVGACFARPFAEISPFAADDHRSPLRIFRKYRLYIDILFVV